MTPEEKAEALRLGMQLRRHRLNIGLSIRELAERLDLSHQMIQKYEKGVSRISSARIRRLIEIFGITYAEFLEEATPHTATKPTLPVAGRVLTEPEERLLSAFNHLTERAQRKVVLDLVETMAFKTDHSAR